MSLRSSTVLEEQVEEKRLAKVVTMPSLSLLRTETVPSRRRPFAAGFVVQIIFVLVLIRVAAYTPKLIHTDVRQSVTLIAPRLEEPTPPPPHMRVVAPKLSKPLPLPKATPTPEIQPPPVEAKLEPPKPLPTPPVPVPVRHVEVNHFAAAPTPQPPAPPKPEVKTNVFAGSATEATVKAPVQQVQTGGFGNPAGFKGNAAEAKMNAPRLGAFDKAAGPGDGNGLGGAHGRPGVVASAGFGDGGVAASGNHNTPGGGIHQGGFGDARTAESGAPLEVRNNVPAAMVPVQIVEKPQPQYTKEARDLKIEGEVHLKVVFQADGTIRVLQVVQGLGHGLDQAAMAAAQRIRFKPALRDGRPCDMTATVHIVFQLAS